MAIEKPFIAFILGPTASGKGTLCARLADKHPRLYHISVGDLLRSLATENPAIPELGLVKYGGTKGLVPGDVVVKLLCDEMKQRMRSTAKKGFLIDGFPRSLEQAEAWKTVGHETFGTDKPDLFIEIDCPRDICRKRYEGRKRKDDSLELFEKRFDDYESREMKVIELYRNSNCQKINIDGSGTAKEMFAELKAKLAEQTAWNDMLKIDMGSWVAGGAWV